MNNNTISILDINFSNEKIVNIFHYLKNNGGLMTVPAAPALVTINYDHAYFISLQKSDIVIPDSGYMVFIWNLLSRIKLKKLSGLAFLNYYIQQPELIGESLFLVNPSLEDSTANLKYLNNLGFHINAKQSYLAPYYKVKIIDDVLIKILESQKPKWILINIGGGTQEKLGLYLKENLSYKPAIICTGAAIAFKTGRQAKIPDWMDHYYLGWLSRCISNPKLYIPRYLKGFKLLFMILKYKLKK